MDVLSVEFVPVFFASGRSKFYSAEKFRADLLDWPAQAFSSNEVEPKPGDVYLGLDLQSSDQLQNELFNWKEKGASVYFVLYDVLPLVNPTFFPEVALESFAKWAKMTSKFDGVFSISKTALGDYVNIFQPQASDFKTGVFTLGADFTTNFLDLGPKPPIVHSRSQIEFLMVGTLEPRKGHLEVLEGFHKLWNQGFQGRLTIVGKWG
jgi:glycosyltransferase involved in cell wall biosynthesis